LRIARGISYDEAMILFSPTHLVLHMGLDFPVGTAILNRPMLMRPLAIKTRTPS
jgi:hypothetical protein